MITMQVKGFAEMDRALARLSVNLNEKMIVKALKDAGDPIAYMARALAPRGELDPALLKGRKRPPGHMADTIRVREDRHYVGVGVCVAVSYARAYFWGMFQEFGTDGFDAQPFLRPAWDSYERAIPELFADSLRPMVIRAMRDAAGEAA